MPRSFCEATFVHADEEDGGFRYIAEGEPLESCDNSTPSIHCRSDDENRANEAVDQGHLAQRTALGMRNGERGTGGKQRSESQNRAWQHSFNGRTRGGKLTGDADERTPTEMKPRLGHALSAVTMLKYLEYRRQRARRSTEKMTPT